ncbi:protein YrbN [Citrobacter sp.]
MIAITFTGEGVCRLAAINFEAHVLHG